MRIRLMQSTYIGTFLAAIGLIYVIFLYYTTSSNLRLAESKLDKLTEINERLAAQQQVVVGHKQRLERSLDEAKDKLIAAKEDAEKRYQGLKALKEELQQKLEQEAAARVRVEEDSKRLAEQNNVEYQSLKQEKDADIARLTNEFNSQKAEAQRQKAEADRLLADAAGLRKDLETARADAEKVKELQKTIVSLEAEVARLRQLTPSPTTVVLAASPSSTTAAAVAAEAVPGRSNVTALESLGGGQAVPAQQGAASVGPAGPAHQQLEVDGKQQPVEGIRQYAALSTTAGVVTAGSATAAVGGGAAAQVAAGAAAAAVVAIDDQNPDQQHQVVAPLGLGNGKEHDEKVADPVGGGDDDDGGAGNGDEDDPEGRVHAEEHARPHMQLPLPNSLLMKHLRKAGANDRRPAVQANAGEAGPQAAVNVADSMQMRKPPAVLEEGKDDRQSLTRTAVNKLQDIL